MNKERAYKSKRIMQKLNVEMKESFEKITFEKITFKKIIKKACVENPM